MRRFFLLLISLSVVASCSLVDGVVHSKKDKRVARIGGEVLYESDIVHLLPVGVSSVDSAAMVESYVKAWAVSKLMLKQAQKQLSKADKDVDEEVDEFRNNLLQYRYEQKLISGHLDTVISESEAMDYYKEHTNTYTLPYTIVKARVIRISPKSPYFDLIKEGYTVSAPSDVEQLEQLCYSSAEKYNDFGKGWTQLSVLAKELGQDVESCRNDLHQIVYEKDVDGLHYLVYIIDRADIGEPMPFDYCRKNVMETIIIKRKQDLMKSLEQELLDDAVSDRKLILYNSKKDE